MPSTDKQKSYYQKWRAKSPANYFTMTPRARWASICVVFRHILIADCNFEKRIPNPYGRRGKPTI